MASQLDGKKIAFLLAQEGVEEVELFQPSRQGLDLHGDKTLAEANPSDYQGVVLPGGVANPDQLWTEEKAVRAVSEGENAVAGSGATAGGESS